MKYEHQKIEPKWQKHWAEEKLFEAKEDSKKEKYYVLDMFPYPSGAGLHVGHPEGYTATDIVSRKARMDGKQVLHPMGWDSFGLPAENYAIQTGVHPDQSTHANIANFTRQIKSLGFSYDWTREITTCDADYYRWTQWWFLHLYKQGLAYRKEAAVNWCDDCKTVLANEQVVDGKCDRCQHEVQQKQMNQWFFRITDFIEDNDKTKGLISGLDAIDWPESTKANQKNWIGKSEGAEVDFTICHSERSEESRDPSSQAPQDDNLKITVFTTRPDTLYGCTFLVLAPEHALVKSWRAKIENWEEVEAYTVAAGKKTELERQEQKEKTGVKLAGITATNPINGEPVPVYIADYVLAGYGTGAIMAVPAHDERDFEFATKYKIEIRRVIQPENVVSKSVVGAYDDEMSGSRIADELKSKAWTGTGELINSGECDGLDSTTAKAKITAQLESDGTGRTKTTYKLRDWLVSRQRYWGAPIPIIHCPDCGEVPVPESELPVTLPTDVDFRPTGESPLTASAEFHAVKCPKCGNAKARRESDTMDTFVCSSWYFFRYADPQSSTEFASKASLKRWCPVDLYVGGAEHTVMHLLYARFFAKVAHHSGLIDFDEPFVKLRHQGMILGEDGQKMSKSRGNVINPDEIVKKHGADTLRCYEMFMGPFEASCPWQTQGVVGVRRFLDKVWRLYTDKTIEPKPAEGCAASATPDFKRALNQTIKKVTGDIDSFDFNTALSQMMIFVNFAGGQDALPQPGMEKFLKILSPFAPHLAEELWEKLGHTESIQLESWPTYNPELITEDTITLVVQINGKVRDQLEVATDIAKDDALKIAKESAKIQSWLKGKEIVKEIFVPGKLVNIVVK